MGTQRICLVTVHGIGFQQPPDDPQGVRGYADRLHENLHALLGGNDDGISILGDDPNRLRADPPVRGPIYVQSLWQDADGAHPTREGGLRRLGSWKANGDIDHSSPETALLHGDASVAHIALVYSNLERSYAQDPGPHIGETIEMVGKSLVSLDHYASMVGLLQMLVQDARGVLHRDPPEAQPASLRPRTDVAHRPRRPDLLHHGVPSGGGLLDSVRALEDDVATYVCRNELRERVRSFVREVLLRLCGRDDVDGVIINAHSQGTVVAYDVVRELTHEAAGKIRGIVTAGSPLRKYTDFFAWGNEAGSVHAIGPWADVEGDRPEGPWVNFYDAADPVADPLAPDWRWHRGMSSGTYPDTRGLFVRDDPDTGATYRLPIVDIAVDNVNRSEGGGLQAHNYWDNMAEVIPTLAALVRAASREAP
jgi:hypothetical protein